MEQQQIEERTIDLREIFLVIRKRIIWLIAAALICGAGAGIYSFYIAEPVYSSTSKLYILTQSTSITSFADIQLGSSLALDYLELIKSRPVVETVIGDLDLELSYEDLLKQLTVKNPTSTRIIEITINDTDAYMAKNIANAFSKVAQRKISEIMKTDEPSVVENAVLAEKPISPQKGRTILIGLLIGLILAAVVVIARYLTDDTFKNPGDVERYLGLNTIAVIPIDETVEKKKFRRRK